MYVVCPFRNAELPVWLLAWKDSINLQYLLGDFVWCFAVTSES
jgi:hypothetical protein